MGQGHGEVVRVVPRRGDAEVGYGGQVVAEGALLRPLDPPGEHVGGDGAPGSLFSGVVRFHGSNVSTSITSNLRLCQSITYTMLMLMVNSHVNAFQISRQH